MRFAHLPFWSPTTPCIRSTNMILTLRMHLDLRVLALSGNTKNRVLTCRAPTKQRSLLLNPARPELVNAVSVCRCTPTQVALKFVLYKRRESNLMNFVEPSRFIFIGLTFLHRFYSLLLEGYYSRA